MKAGDKFEVICGAFCGQEGTIVKKTWRGRDPLFIVWLNRHPGDMLMPLSWMKPIETATVVEASR